MGNDWNSFMQDKKIRSVMYGVAASFCVFHAVRAIYGLVTGSDQTAAALIEQIGQGGYVALTVAQAVVCLWAGAMFIRYIFKMMSEDD